MPFDFLVVEKFKFLHLHTHLNFYTMKTLSKLLFTVGLLFLSGFYSFAQSNASTNKDAVAYLSINGDKMGNIENNIDYKTSFFIKHFSLTEQEKQTHITNVMNSKYGFKELIINDANDSQEKGVKDVIVIINVSASTIAELTEKIKFLLTELGVGKVDYNNALYTLKDFKF